MKVTAIIITMTLLSCSTKKQLQMQTGTFTSYNGHVKFEPNSAWKSIPLDTTWRGFRVRNTAVKKHQLTY